MVVILGLLCFLGTTTSAFCVQISRQIYSVSALQFITLPAKPSSVQLSDSRGHRSIFYFSSFSLSFIFISCSIVSFCYLQFLRSTEQVSVDG